VSNTQPDIQSIVIGIAKSNAEFVAKIAIGEVNGCTLIEKTNQDSSQRTMIESLERYISDSDTTQRLFW
jgi:hypothetical protein